MGFPFTKENLFFFIFSQYCGPFLISWPFPSWTCFNLVDTTFLFCSCLHMCMCTNVHKRRNCFVIVPWAACSSLRRRLLIPTHFLLTLHTNCDIMIRVLFIIHKLLIANKNIKIHHLIKIIGNMFLKNQPIPMSFGMSPKILYSWQILFSPRPSQIPIKFS